MRTFTILVALVALISSSVASATTLDETISSMDAKLSQDVLLCPTVLYADGKAECQSLMELGFDEIGIDPTIVTVVVEPTPSFADTLLQIHEHETRKRLLSMKTQNANQNNSRPTVVAKR